MGKTKKNKVKKNRIIEVIIKNGKQKKGKEFRVSNNEHLKKVAEYLRLYIYQKSIDDMDLTTEIKFKLDGEKISPRDLKDFLKSNISEESSIKSSVDKKSKKKKDKKSKKGKKKNSTINKNNPYLIPINPVAEKKSKKKDKNKAKKYKTKGTLVLHADLKRSK